MHVILGADHGGFKIKEEIKQQLLSEGYEVIDVGATSLVQDDDFVDYAKAAVKEVASSNDRIILFCRNGFGMAIAANRFTGIRCGTAFGIEAVAKGRTDDDINCLSVPSDYMDKKMIEEMIKVLLNEKFAGDENYKRRIMKLDNIVV